MRPADYSTKTSTLEDEVPGSQNIVVNLVVSHRFHEEVDTKIFVHVTEMAQKSFLVMVRTVDADVVMIAIAHFTT